MRDAFRFVQRGAVSICTQASGNPAHPPILLVMGATASMMWWPDLLCRSLAERGRFVIRFDHRDTGASTTGAPGEAGYGVADLADDTLAVLDAYGLARAHLVGMSLGAYIAQLIALRNPKRVNTLTLIAAEPLGGASMPPPAMSPEFLAHFATMDAVDWQDEAAVHRFLDRIAALSASPVRGHDRAATAERIEREWSRSADMRAAFNHASVGGDLSRWHLTGIAAPTLVIHGAHDPIVPLAHGEATARQIPSAELVVLPDAGHELHPDDLDEIAQRVFAHTA